VEKYASLETTFREK